MAERALPVMKPALHIGLVFCIFILLPKWGDGKYIEGHLVTREEWAFIGRFCFLSQRGRLEFEFEYPQKDYEPQNILLYYDSADQWPAVYKTNKNCREKEAVLSWQNNQIINLTTRFELSGCNIDDIDGVDTYNCSGGRSFRSTRERWWFVAVSHCGGTQNCWQKEAVVHPENNQIIYLSIFFSGSGCKVFNTTGKPTYHCEGGRQFSSSRERWWYVAASKCGSSKGLNLKYNLTMTNGPEGDIFFRHFSADEFYILQVDIAFLVLFFVMCIISIVCGVVLRSRQLFHTTYKLFIASLFCETIYLLIMCIAYGKYANDGRENLGLKTFGRIFESASSLIFLLLLILMAKGYTITRGRLSTSGSIKIAVFMTLFTITYIVLFIFESNFFDPGLVLYLYESPPGYGLIALRLIGWVWFCYAIFFTLKHFPEKASFYYPLFIFYTIWFWAGPIVIIVALRTLDLWVREKIVHGIDVCVVSISYIAFLFLTRPTAANKNFPYHVRTSQIGVMNTGQAAANGGIPLSASPESDSFTRYAYAPSEPPPPYSGATPPATNFTELFTVSNTYNSKTAANIDRYPHQRPGQNPFVVSG